jgi:hypothetical protein
MLPARYSGQGLDKRSLQDQLIRRKTDDKTKEDSKLKSDKKHRK